MLTTIATTTATYDGAAIFGVTVTLILLIALAVLWLYPVAKIWSARGPFMGMLAFLFGFTGLGLFVNFVLAFVIGGEERKGTRRRYQRRSSVRRSLR